MYVVLILAPFVVFAMLVFFAGNIERLAALFDSVPWGGLTGLLILAAATAWYLHR